jgi:hypothetical protein
MTVTHTQSAAYMRQCTTTTTLGSDVAAPNPQGFGAAMCRAVVNWMLQPDTKGEKGGLSQMVRS